MVVETIKFTEMKSSLLSHSQDEFVLQKDKFIVQEDDLQNLTQNLYKDTKRKPRLKIHRNG